MLNTNWCNSWQIKDASNKTRARLHIIIKIPQPFKNNSDLLGVGGLQAKCNPECIALKTTMPNFNLLVCGAFISIILDKNYDKI